jgi:hypothetical protein
MSNSKTNNDEDLKLKKLNLGIGINKSLVVRTFDSILEKRGYKLLNTIGNGSYAKVKLVGFFFSKNYFLK